MLNKDSSINAGDKSTNNQAKTINNTYGLSYQDVKEIANDLFKSNFITLKAEAAAVASERASEITEKFLIKLKEEAPESINEFSTPGMQDTFYNAQKEYAISGDENLANMLVEMLIDRAKSPEKNRKRLILDESLKVAPKLSIQQMDLLTLSHTCFYSQHSHVLNFESLIKNITLDFSYLDSINENEIDDDLYFLDYLRLGRIENNRFPDITDCLLMTYPIYFTSGFTKEECVVPEIEGKDLFIRSFHHNDKIQFKFAKKDYLISFLKDRNLTDERIDYISSFYDRNLITNKEVEKILNLRIPNYNRVLEIFKNSKLTHFQLTNVGKAIAISNYQRNFGVKHNLSLWIK